MTRRIWAKKLNLYQSQNLFQNHSPSRKNTMTMSSSSLQMEVSPKRFSSKVSMDYSPNKGKRCLSTMKVD